MPLHVFQKLFLRSRQISLKQFNPFKEQLKCEPENFITEYP